MSSEKKVLEIDNLTKSYGKARGIVDVSLTVEEGEIFGFIGPNGAGKSTTIRTILGLLYPDSGTLRLFGRDALKEGPKLRKDTGFVPSELNFYEGIKTGDLLKYAADLYEVDAVDKVREYAERLRLDLNRPVRDLSLGNRKKAAIIQGILPSPKLLILDEPTSGLDPLIQSRFYEILREQQKEGTTIFFSSHTLSEVERLCDRVAIIREGRIVRISEMNELKLLSLKRFRLLFPPGKRPDEDQIRQKLPEITELQLHKRSIEGLYGGSIQRLLETINQWPLSDLTLEDPGLEELFMHYYKEETV